MLNRPESSHVIALDVGGTSVKHAVVAAGGTLAGAPRVTAIDSNGPAEAILAAFAEIVRGRLAEVPAGALRGVAFGFCGPFDYDKGVCLITEQPKFRGLYGMSIPAELRRRTAIGEAPAVFRNDAECAIAGEARYGAGRRFRRLIGVTLGTGLGSAFLDNGRRVAQGPDVPADDGWLWPVKYRNGMADDHFSKRGIEARVKAAGLAASGVKEAADAARAGNAAARGVLEAWGGELGAFLAPWAKGFRAEALLVLGRIAGAFDLFGPALRASLPCPVLKGERPDEAALLGAADLLLGRQR